MGDIIQLLPDSVANQIAAGEVVQRPSSVVKELMENAIDAGACTVRVVLQHAGKSRVQVIDDGKGMSPKDARMAFERHATSKISTSLDLFHLRTMGFRGEALASIASVAEVEARTRRAGDELGTFLLLADSELKRQEHVSCDKGTSVTVKNLFYNVPARRKFLKSDATEARNVVTAFLRVALAWPGVAFTLENNGTVIYDLPASGRRQRLVDTFGRGLDGTLVPVSCETGIVSISGFACTPSRARKSPGEHYFFANDRFMKHGFFHKAVVEAYSRLIGAESIPSYFLYFTVDPSTIDVNIHPTKTEIKFQDEVAIFQILLASVREALGKFNITPAIDFDTEGQVEIPGERGEAGVPREPVVSYTPGYSPFHYRSSLYPGSSTFEGEAGVPARWEGLFEAVREERQVEQARIPGMLPGELSGGGEHVFAVEAAVYRDVVALRSCFYRPGAGARAGVVRSLPAVAGAAPGAWSAVSFPGGCRVPGGGLLAGA